MYRVTKTNKRGKKVTVAQSLLPFWREESFNLHGEKVTPLCISEMEQHRLSRGDHLHNKLEYVDCEILSARLCDSVAHTHHRLQLH